MESELTIKFTVSIILFSRYTEFYRDVLHFIAISKICCLYRENKVMETVNFLRCLIVNLREEQNI